MKIKGSTSPDTLFGSNGDDFVYSLGGYDVVKTGAGDDVVSAFGEIDTADGNDRMFNIYSGSPIDKKYPGIINPMGSGGDAHMGAGNDLYVTLFDDQFVTRDVNYGSDVFLGTGNDTAIVGEGNAYVWLGGGKDKAYVSGPARIDAADFISDSSPIMQDVKDTIYIDAQFMKNSPGGINTMVQIFQVGAKDKIVLYDTDLSVQDLKIRATQTLGGTHLSIALEGGKIEIDYSFQEHGVAEVNSKTFGTTSSKLPHLLDAPNGAETHMSKMYIGSDAADRLTVTSHNVAHMQAGNDIVHGSSKGDALYGEIGNDTLDGNGGKDTLSGGVGNDKLDGGGGDDTIDLGGGIDNAQGGAGDDTIYAGTGNCKIDGGGGDDKIYTYATYIGQQGKAVINLGAGHNTLFIDGDPDVHATVKDFDFRKDSIHIEVNDYGDLPEYTGHGFFTKALFEYDNGVFLNTNYGTAPDPSERGIFFEGVTKAELLHADITM